MNANPSLWLANTPRRSFPSLAGEHRVDVAIVGGGITGITLAALLKRAGKRVAVLEARQVGDGVTGRTTAHLTEAVDARYSQLHKDFGEDGARMVAQSSRAAIDRIEAFVREHAIDCGFERVPGYLYSERESDLGALHEEFEFARKATATVSMTRDVPLPFPTAAGVRFENQAQVDAARYLTAMAHTVPGGGCHVFENSHVRALEDGTPCSAVTDGGRVTADVVVSATNAPLTLFFGQTKIANYRSYAIAFEASSSFENALFWDLDDPYHYTRTAVVAGKRYAIVGGEDHKTGQIRNTDVSFERLVAYARRRFSFGDVAFRWSSQVCEPYDGLPYIGRSSQFSNVFIATGFGGNGMTFGTLAASILADSITGRANAWTALYDAARKKVVHAKEYVAENIDFPTYMLKDRLRGAEASSPDQVPAGSGKIVRVRGKKLAVYRGEDGTVTAVSPICPHMGCLVHFNTAERTWDCPCHGSRFSTSGEVLEGPSLRGLVRIELSRPHSLFPSFARWRRASTAKD